MTRHTSEIEDVTIAGELRPGAITICAAHPADDFGADTAALLNQITGHPIVCVNMRAGRSIAAMAEDVERVRQRLGLGPWVFWGMSGGGWIGEQHARSHPQAVAGLILESACACFRARLADPACVLSPFFPAWRPAMEASGLIADGSHDQVGDVADTAWTEVAGAGTVFRRRGGPALLVSPAPIAPAMQAAMPALWAFDARPWLSELRCRTLVIAGAADPVVPLAHARALHQAIPGAALAVIEGGGHVPSAQGNVEARAAVTGFLRALPGAVAAPRPA